MSGSHVVALADTDSGLRNKKRRKPRGLVAAITSDVADDEIKEVNSCVGRTEH